MLWTEAERARLRELRPLMGLRQIAAELGRPCGSVAHESSRLGLFRPRGSSWNEGEIARIALMWPDHSASEIGDRLGRSRNAVIGIIHRLREKKMKLQRKTSAHPVRARQPRIRHRPTIANKSPPQQPEPAAMLMQCPCQLVELEAVSCKWPHGDPKREGFFFCGAIRMNGYPYCARHQAIAHERGASVKQQHKEQHHGKTS